MNISYEDLLKMSTTDLRDLNRIIVKELQHRNRAMAADLHCGSKVTWIAKGIRYTGTIIKFNRKSVDVISTGGMCWRVSPGLLSELKASEKTPA